MLQNPRYGPAVLSVLAALSVRRRLVHFKAPLHKQYSIHGAQITWDLLSRYALIALSSYAIVVGKEQEIVKARE